MTEYDAVVVTCLQVLERRGETLGTAESLTAGLVAATLATVPGASTVLRGGVAAYATDVKIEVLGVDAHIIADHGVYSAACAEQMALCVRDLLTCDWGIATTGVAGPEAQDGHPVGEVHVAVAGPSGVTARSLELPGERQEIRAASVAAVLGLLLERLELPA